MDNLHDQVHREMMHDYEDDRAARQADAYDEADEDARPRQDPNHLDWLKTFGRFGCGR